MTIASLTQIKNNFEPYVPIRYKVYFEGDGAPLNILGDSFPAKEVEYARITIQHDDVEIAPGVSIPVLMSTLPVTSLNITFYDNVKLDIYKFFAAMYGKVTEGSGGFGDGTSVECWIEEYDNGLNVVSRNGYVVEFGGSWTKLLGQDPTPFELPIEFKVIGVLQED